MDLPSYTSSRFRLETVWGQPQTADVEQGELNHTKGFGMLRHLKSLLLEPGCQNYKKMNEKCPKIKFTLICNELCVNRLDD